MGPHLFIAILSLIAGTVQIALPTVYSNETAAFGPLKFSSDGTFQISIFEDLHFGENAWQTWGPQQDINSAKVIDEILNHETPDLVVLNGDLITGENAFKENATVYIDQIVAPLVERKLTWASTYGNHDSQFNLSRADILAREQQWPNSRTASMVSDELAGVSNYYLPVYPYECDNSTRASSCPPELILWFFDSRGGNYYQQVDSAGQYVPQPDWVDQSVVTWFNYTKIRLAQDYSSTIPSLAFVHIPTRASRLLQAANKIDQNHEPGVNDDNPLAGQADSWCENGSVGCDYGGQDVPFMEALANTEGLMAVFSGHDHGDTWCVKWNDTLPSMDFSGNGLNLCFGQHTGYGGYGHWIRGARQVLVSQEQLADLAVETWIRTEHASVVGAVNLNSSYGTDIYPSTLDEKTDCPTCVY